VLEVAGEGAGHLRHLTAIFAAAASIREQLVAAAYASSSFWPPLTCH